MNPASFERRVPTISILLATAVLVLATSTRAAQAQSILLPGGSMDLVLTGNELQCNLDHDSGICHALSPTIPGAAWPAGSPNAYMFNSGLMIAAIIGPGGPWAGDTVGDFFYNASGGTIASPITNIWNSLDPEHVADWPEAGDIPAFPFLSAHVDDPDVFSDAVLGREAASQQDSWLVYWDGDPRKTGGRPHPAGIIVEQRTLAWNYPAGNEGTLYLVFEITNVSNNPYFQQLQEGHVFRDQPPVGELPDGGWTLEDVHVAYAADPDVTRNAGGNFASTILPFDMAIAYDGDFVATEFRYPPPIFYTPFFNDAPGILATQLLRTPNESGLTMFSGYLGGGTFSDPSGSDQLYRYLSGDVRAELGDDPCWFANARQRRFCYINSSPTDIRYFQASGPFDLGPGETVTVVLAMFAAATVEVNPGGSTVTPGMQNRPLVANEPNASPSLHPGCHGDPITNIERAAGWISTNACPPEGRPLDPFDVAVVEQSLLHKAQVAQTLFDNRFLLPAAPEPPEFQLIPGDDQVTVIWEPSGTEQSGDPFGSAAVDPASPLYNPNFRADDLEGYRIYRSSDGVNFALIAQFDRIGTTFIDELCETADDHFAGDACTSEREIPLAGRLVQYSAGDIVQLVDGSPLVLDGDTAPATAFPPLEDTGIPYAFVDTDARNGFQYFYRVTAFDVNSLASGPASLESTSLEPIAVVPGPRVAAEEADLRRIRVAPDPYYGASIYDLGPADRNLRFFNLPPQASIRIFTASGILVDVLNHDDPSSATATWDMRNRTGLMIASGVYFYHVTTPDGREHIGRFTVIHSGLSR